MTYLNPLLGAVLLTGAALMSVQASAAVYPLKSDDMNLNDRYLTFSHSALTEEGAGKEILAVRYLGDGQWSQLAEGGHPYSNADHLIFGKKVYAMLSGTVINCWRNAPDNVESGTVDNDAPNNMISWRGNLLWIRSDDGVYTLYGSLKSGSIPAAICPIDKVRFDKPSDAAFPPEGMVTNGARVTQGQYIGMVGNSGMTPGPHLHVHTLRFGKPYELKFEHGQSTPYIKERASPNGPWTLLKGNPLPAEAVLVWAPRSTAYWTVNNVSSTAFQGWFNHMTDSGQMAESLACSAGGATYNTQWVPAKGAWTAAAGISAAQLASTTNTLALQGYTQYNAWSCGAVRSAIWRK